MTTATDFANYFRSKIDKICEGTASASPPIIRNGACVSLSELDDVTSEEMSKIIHNAPSKRCSLDPAPTWLVKRLLLLLAETLAKMCNASFDEGSFPETLRL